MGPYFYNCSCGEIPSEAIGINRNPGELLFSSFNAASASAASRCMGAPISGTSSTLFWSPIFQRDTAQDRCLKHNDNC
tara:strand:- start:1303 stop:1536 length:234 start_codon:yes stop_codon:yes gene_type:complete